MNNVDLKYTNNATLAKILFDEIATWQTLKNPTRSLESMEREIESILDKVEEKGYNKAKNL